MERIFTVIILSFMFLKLQAQAVLQLKQLPSNTPRDARFSIICEQNNWNATADSAFTLKK